MLKVLPSFPPAQLTNTKCGEIFCQSSTNFTIICTFCDMKTFEFEDFLLHFRNVHLENSLLESKDVNSECESYLEINVKTELNNEELAKSTTTTDILSDFVVVNSMQCSNDITSYDQSSEQSNDNDSSCGDDADDDDEWQPTVNKKVNEDPKPKKQRLKQEKEFECDQCKRRYKTEGMLKQHIQKYHVENNTSIHQCDQCPEKFPLFHLLNSHMINTHHGFQCTQCDRKYQSKFDLKKHAVKHTGIRNFVCDFENCGKRFFLKNELTIHKRNHTEPLRFICETCGYTCRIKETLRVHYRTHTGEKPYACSLCDKRFATSSMLKEHQPIHSKERPHVCDVCGAAFSRPKALYHHKHLHLGIKKFKCKLCGNAYAQAAGLAGHMRQHKADKF